MHHSSLPRAAAVISLLALLALARAPEAAASPGSPGAAAAAYLRARAAACLTGGSGLHALCLPGWRQLAAEQVIARGVRRAHTALGQRLATGECRVTLGAVTLAPDGRSATVAAHAVTTVAWTTTDGSRDREATGLDHTIALRLVAGRWLVAGDTYFDDLAPRYLEAGGAAQKTVRAAAARNEAKSRAFALSACTAVGPSTGIAAPSLVGPTFYPAGPMPDAGPGVFPATRLGYRAILYYDRDAAKAYADKYALSYNPTYVAFSADCANFGSQTMFAGGYPKALGGYEQGWWYDKEGTSSPGDDTWSHSWIAVIPQMQYWNARYTDVVSSAGDCARGDFVYYDWTGDGTWDHVAEFAGTNSSGQRVVDAHTTDHYHVYWKLGTSATHYRFAHTRDQIRI
jgi:cell wall-associated NlpC family hydrolase